MGVIYRLKPEIRNWIVEKKRVTPLLSCRGLISLLEGEFKIKVSKSSVNFFIKEAGLSMPVGRRQKKRRKTPAVVQLQLESTLETPLQLPLPTPAELAPQTPAETQPEPPEETPAQIQPEAPRETPAQPEAEIPLETPLAEIPASTQPEVPIEAPPPTPAETPPPTPAPMPTEVLERTLSSGIILLKAADYLIGGSYYIGETIKKRLRLEDKNLLEKIDDLIYAPLLGISEESFQAHLNGLSGIESMAQGILRVLAGALTEVRCLKVVLSEKDALYLDGQLHTIWSVPNIPYDFLNTLHNIKNYLNKSFLEGQPFILSMAPGYDRPTAELFNFIFALAGQTNKTVKLTLYGNKLEELDSFYLEQGKQYPLVFGLWPWQFVEYRRVKKIGEFKPFFFAAQNKNLYLAEIEMELLEPNKKQAITLFGCALKTNLAEKTRLIILGNGSEELAKPEYLAGIYLSRWPNLEETFQDFSRKVELFTYAVTSQRFFSADSLNITEGTAQIKQLFNQYLALLDLYVKWHFLPAAYEAQDFSAIKESFYNLKASSQPQKEHTLITFQRPEEADPLKALEYACCRLNEREITLADGRRLWFSL